MNDSRGTQQAMPTSLDKMTLKAVLDHGAASYPDLPALTLLGKYSISFSDLHHKAVYLRNWLAEQGIVHGDRVAILSENSPHWGLAFFAVTSMGAVAVPMLTEFHPDAMKHILRHSEAKIVFVSERLLGKIPVFEAGTGPLYINIDTFELVNGKHSDDMFSSMLSAGKREFDKFKDLAKKQMSRFGAFGDNAAAPSPEEEDIACIIYTSGTTGHSKGVVLTHKNIVYEAVAVETIFTVHPSDRFISILPLAHTYECTLGLVLPILSGACVTYIGKPPTARALLPAMLQVRPTCILSVPLIMEKIYKTSIQPKLSANWLLRLLMRFAPTRKFLHRQAGKKLMESFGGHVRIFTIGGAPLSPTVEAFLHEARFPYAIGYGLTETSPMSAATAPYDTRLYAAGKSIQGVEIRIDYSESRNGAGEILIKGPNVMREYYLEPELTKNVITEDGFLRTGDLGSLDEDGYLFIKGRIKNVIIGASGENIYPEEIESVIMRSPYVLECMVLQYNEKPAARVYLDHTVIEERFGNLDSDKLRKKTKELLDELRAEVNSQVSAFARLHQVIEQSEPFEKTPTQKIKRYLYTA